VRGPPLPRPTWRAFGLALQGRPLPERAPAPTAELARDALAHRLEGVLHRALTGGPRWARDLAEALEPDVRRAAMLDALRTRADLDALAITGGVVLKGAALAHTVYDAPHDRPRTDLDVWIEPERADAVDRDLRRAGYTAHLDLPSDLRALARSYARTDDRGFVHALDVHLAPVRSVVHVDAFDRAGAWRRARPLPALGARALAAEDALVVTAIHAFANNPSARRAITLVDVARLAAAGPDWDLALELARRARASSLLWTAASRARAWLDAPIPALAASLPADESRAYLLAPPALAPALEIALSEDLPSLVRRAGDHLWPEAEYLRARAGVGRAVPRWRLALARLLGG
jgi:hypothetical protein